MVSLRFVVWVGASLPFVLASDRRGSIHKRQEHSGHGAKSGDGTMSGGETGGATMGGGMGGLGGMDLTNPTISSLISTALNWGSGILPELPLYKIEHLVPTVKKPGVTRVQMLFGPLVIQTPAYRKANPNGMGLDPQGTPYYSKLVDFPSDITIVTSETYPVWEDGTPTTVADGIYNHHMVFADSSRAPPKILACPGKPATASMPLSIFAATGQEGGNSNFTTNNRRVNTGFYVSKNDRSIFFGELVNYKDKPQTVYAFLDLEYIPGKVGLDTSQEPISVTQCEGTGTAIRPQKGQSRFTAQSKDMEFQYDGYLFSARGHLHDGGDKLQVSVNGKSVCESKAIYGGTKNGEKWNSIKEMSICTGPVEVKKGDKLKIEAFYDLERYPARGHAGGGEAEEMGIVNLQFARIE